MHLFHFITSGGKIRTFSEVLSGRSVCLILPNELRPAVLEGDRPVEDGPFGRRIPVGTEIPLAEELETLKETVAGQASDGLGEGFEQREIKVDGNELFAHLWQDSGWSIQTEQEAFAPKLAEGLPELCFSVLPGTGDLICIKRGESGYYPSDWSTNDKEQNAELADYNNERLGVTPEQRQAMEVGSMAGWDVPGADPANYGGHFTQMGGMTLE